ncbi:MAG: hypothetical protein ACYTHM_11175 [Planctomycetota bacterium]
MPHWLSTAILNLVTASAFIPYFFGCRRFYLKKSYFMPLLGFGLSIDIAMAICGSFGILPGSSAGGATKSVLFWVHAGLAGFGMIAFFFLFFGLLIMGWKKEYKFLRFFTYRIILPAWTLGVCIALTSYIMKQFFDVRIYDYF